MRQASQATHAGGDSRAVITEGQGQDPQIPEPGVPRPGGLASIRSRLHVQGFSEGATATLLARRGKSTFKKYDECWRAFAGWRSARDSDPFSALMLDIVEFCNPFLKKGFASRTLKVYSSAISAFHLGLNGRDSTQQFRGFWPGLPESDPLPSYYPSGTSTQCWYL